MAPKKKDPQELVRKQVEGALKVYNDPAVSTKSKARVKRTLDSLFDKDPETVTTMGYVRDEGTSAQHLRVFKFGCLAPPIEESEVHLGETSHQMRLRDDFYNEMVEATKPLFAEAREALLRGAGFQAWFSVQGRIEALYAEIRAINREQRRRVKDDPRVLNNLASIKALAEERRELWKAVSPELAEFRRGPVPRELKARRDTITGECRKRYAAKGLFWTNYNPTVVEFHQAFDLGFKDSRTLFSGLNYRFELKDGSRPPDLVQWEKWEGSGRTGVIMGTGTKLTHRVVESAFNGKNTYLQLRPLTPSDLPRFPRLPEITWGTEDTERIHIARVTLTPSKGGRSVAYALIPVVLHRDFPVDAEFRSADIVSKAVGLGLEYSLNVTIAEDRAPRRDAGDTATVKIAFDKAAGTFGTVTREGLSDVIAQMAKLPGSAGALLTADGGLRLNPDMTRVEAHSGGLDATVTEHIKKAGELVDEWMEKHALPEWFAAYKLDLRGRRQMRTAYHLWSKRLIDKAAKKGEAQRLQAAKQFSTMRRKSAELVSVDWDAAVDRTTHFLREQFKLSASEGRLLALLLVVTERYEHLYPWSVNVRSKGMLRRREGYRQFAALFLDGVKVLHLPAEKLGSRRLSSEQRAAAPYELLSALKNFATREGVHVVMEKSSKVEAGE